MAHYLVKARPHNLETLRVVLDSGEVLDMQPAGEEMQQCLKPSAHHRGWLGDVGGKLLL